MPIRSNRPKFDDHKFLFSITDRITGKNVMNLIKNNLWRYIFWSPAKGPSFRSETDTFSETEVYDFNVAFLVQKEVLGLEVPVDDSL